MRFVYRCARNTVLVGGSLFAAITLPPIDYIPGALFTTRVRCEGVVRAGRVAYLGAATYYAYGQLLPDASQADWDVVHQRTADALLDLGQRNGGLYCKTVQAIASASDIMPPIFSQTLRKMQDRMTPRDWETEIEPQLKRALKVDDLSLVFEEIEPVAIAAASVAQVHRAWLRRHEDENNNNSNNNNDDDDSSNEKTTSNKKSNNNSTKVAVKVQYPDVQARRHLDLACIILAVKTCGVMWPNFDWSPFIRKCQDVLDAELDFREESRNLKRCHDDMARHFKNDEVVCPNVFDRYTTETTLVLEFVEGCRAGDRERILSMGLSPREVAENFCRAYGYMIFESGWLHVDCHGGNLLVRRHPAADSNENGTRRRAQCVIIDHGLSIYIPPDERRDLADLWTYCTTRDTEKLKAFMRRKGLPEQHYEIFGSMWLQMPYSAFNTQRTTLDFEEIQQMREGYNDPRVNALLAFFPTTWLLAINAVCLYRDVHKELKALQFDGVSRAGVLLRYAIRNGSDAAAKHSWFKTQLALFQLWFWDSMNFLSMRVMFFLNPKLKEAFSDELLMMA